MRSLDELVSYLTERLKIRHWYPGEDGFGGEWIINPEKRKAIEEFAQQVTANAKRSSDAYRDGLIDAAKAVCDCCRLDGTPDDWINHEGEGVRFRHIYDLHEPIDCTAQQIWALIAKHDEANKEAKQ